MLSRAIMPAAVRRPRSLHRKSCLAIVVLLVLLAVTSGDHVWAQTSTTGEITGVVTDPDGAIVPNISVTLKNIETGTATATTTNSLGIYTFPLLQPGKYQLSATATGSSDRSRKPSASRPQSTALDWEPTLLLE